MPNATFFYTRRPFFNLLDTKRNFFLLTVFLLFFPKGGIKWGSIPITWGYLFLSLIALGTLSRQPIFVLTGRLRSFSLLLPFLCIAFWTMALNGVEHFLSATSFWIGFLWLPFIFFILLSRDIDVMEEESFYNICKKGVFFVSIYGIFLFAVKQWNGAFIEIPCLTTNFGDLGLLEEKCINRGNVFKLISTYNNGNIYGICLLMFLPLYCFLENRFWRTAIVKCSLLLTFSRTVWIGLLFHELWFQWIIRKRKWRAVLAMFGIAAACFFLCSYYDLTESFLFDLNLGGRLSSLERLSHTGLFSSEAFSGISEVIYAGVANSFGWVGLFCFSVALFGPLSYQVMSRKPLAIQKCICLGLFNYLFMSFSDGAILLIPTLSFFWFLYSLLHRPSFANSIQRTSASSVV